MSRLDLSRVAIVGTSCSGKTTLAKALADHLSVPHIELDALNWLPGWQERDKAGLRDLVNQATAAPDWVACGNYGSVRDLEHDRLIWDRFDGAKSVRSARRGGPRDAGPSGKRRNDAEEPIWPTKGRFFAPA